MDVKILATRCLVCRHPQRQVVDELLLLGTPLRSLESRFKVSRSTLQRHKRHISEEVLRASEEAYALRREALLKMLVRVALAAEQLAHDAWQAGEPHAVIASISAATRAIGTLLQFLPQQNALVHDIVIDLFDAPPSEWEEPLARLGGNGDR